MNWLLLALLLTVEQGYGPYARPLNGGDAAVAPARGGALLAWSEENRIRTGWLDSRGQLASEVHTLPVQTSRSSAIAPAAASDGNLFFVAWVEIESGLQRTMGVIVARDGAPLGEPRQYGKALAIASNDFTMHLVWDGNAYRLWGGGKVSTIDRAGNVLAAVDLAQMPSGADASNGVDATSSSRVALLHCGFSWCTWDSRVTWTIGAKSDYLQLQQVSGPVTVPSTTQAVRALPLPPTVVADARERFIIAWPAREGIRYLIPGEGSNSVSASPDTSTRPGLACDDTRCVIAYSQSGDVQAFAFEIDRLFGAELLTIAATERTERTPQVHALGNQRFLVLYRSDSVDGARMRWRILTFGTQRQRGIRR